MDFLGETIPGCGPLVEGEPPCGLEVEGLLMNLPSHPRHCRQKASGAEKEQDHT